MKKIFMLLFLLTFAFSLENNILFKSRDCSEINNPEECYDLGCEWITLYEEVENDIIITEECIDPFDDWEDNNNDDGPPECLMDCAGIGDINPSENPYEACDWIISAFGFDPGFASCTGDCSDETMMEINEIVEACYE